MKLIVDIPKEDYNYAKQQVADGITNPLKIFIASGIPLDKIRAEIEQERDKVYQNRRGCDTYYADGLDTALEIIDKYKGE